MNQTVIYLGHYNKPSITKEDRRVSLAAATKIDYIIDVLNKLSFNIDFVSMAEPAGLYFCPGGLFKIKPQCTLRLWSALSGKNKINRFINILLLRKRTEQYLGKLGPDDVVICYHSLEFCKFLSRIKSKTGFRLILEVEEVYADVTGRDIDRELEKSCFESADGFLFSTELLAQKVGCKKRPYAICSGVYRMMPKIVDRRKDGQIHVVYAGTLDPRKGAAAAAAAGALLDGSYAMHILGNGRDDEVEFIKTAVEKANSTSRGCKVTYEGFKSGREFDTFIQSCHIGLSPQSPGAAFNATSFPSKVFMYLSNGLDVVSVDLPVFTDDVRQMLTIVPDNSPHSLVDGIRRTSDTRAHQEFDTAAKIKELDLKFRQELSNLIASVMYSDND